MVAVLLEAVARPDFTVMATGSLESDVAVTVKGNVGESGIELNVIFCSLVAFVVAGFIAWDFT
jgi:hypothetical protein